MDGASCYYYYYYLIIIKVSAFGGQGCALVCGWGFRVQFRFCGRLVFRHCPCLCITLQLQVLMYMLINKC